MKVQIKLLILILLSPLTALLAQDVVVISSSIFGNDFNSAYAISHTSDNEIFDKIHFLSDTDIPEFIHLQIPDKASFHSVTILIRKPPKDPEYYHQSIACYTVWDNKKDTIRSLSITDRQPKKAKIPKSIDVKISVEGIGKLDDIYSLSIRSELKDKTIRLNRKDIEINIDSYTTVGRCIYLTNKNDESYKEIVIHPESSSHFSKDIRVQYEDLVDHTTQEKLDLYTSDKVYVQINANSADGSVYNLYSSPRNLEELDGLDIDLPVNLEIVNYDVTIISRDLTAPDEGHNMASTTQRIENLHDIVLPEIVDVSHFVTGDPSSYSVDLNGAKFDKWALQYPIEGLAKTNVSIPWKSYRSSRWLIYGSVSGKKSRVFVPKLSADIDDDIFGNHGHLLIGQDKWSFIKEYSDGHVETNSYVKQ